MPDLDLIKTLSPLGVGGLLAVVIFIFYRSKSGAVRWWWRSVAEADSAPRVARSLPASAFG
jgi:hypothetical protein